MKLLGGLWRLVRVAQQREYDLDVTDQWLLLTLVRFRECSYRRLEAELSAIRGVPPSEAVASVLKLEEQGLIERKPVAGLAVEERLFRLTRSGRQVGALIPPAPRSPTIFYR